MDLHWILSTWHINLKWDQLLLFTIVGVTEFKEAIAAAINLDPNLDLNLNSKFDSNSKSDATVLSINSISVPVEYTDYDDIFEEKRIQQLPFYRPGIDHDITLTPGSKLFYGSIYNLSETELH